MTYMYVHIHVKLHVYTPSRYLWCIIFYYFTATFKKTQAGSEYFNVNSPLVCSVSEPHSCLLTPPLQNIPTSRDTPANTHLDTVLLVVMGGRGAGGGGII